MSVINRSADRARAAAELAGPAGRVGSTDDVAEADLVVNATSVGMDGASLPLDPVHLSGLSSSHLVADIVMQPLDTPLLQAARAAGAATLGGLGMLVRQAAVAFELWTGQSAPIEVMVQAAQRQ